MEEESSNYTPYLPHEIIFQILYRLPAKTLVRFCCVCKSWQNLITTDQSLINPHLQNQAPRTLLLHSLIDEERCFCESIPDVDAQRIADADHNYTILHNGSVYLGMNVFLVGSSRGLLCFQKECGCGTPRMFLWNPALRQCRLLSSPRTTSRDHWILAVGFDFDPVTEDYKIVRVCGLNMTPELDYDRYEVGIYSLKNHSWKTKTISYGAKLAPKEVPSWDYMGVILDGFLYWIQWTYIGGKVWVNAFDINQEVLEAIFIPDHVPIGEYHRLRLFQGHLSISGFTGLNVFELWVREQSSANSSYSWVKQFAIPNDNLDIQPILSTTDVTPCGKILATIAPEPGGPTERGKPLRRFVLYDPETGRLENLMNGGVYYDRWKGRFWFKYFLVDNFVESLVSVVPPGEKGFPVHTPRKPDKREEKMQNAKNSSAQKLFGCLPSCLGMSRVHA